jgi:hypothetical protein
VYSSVRRCHAAYDERDLVSTVTSFAAAEEGAVVNQVLRTYNGFRQLETEYQSHEGVVETEDPPITPHVT